MGHPCDRPICVRKSPRGGELRNARSPRSRGDATRCLQRDLELSSGLDISPTVSNTPCANTSEQSHGNLFNSDTSLGEGLLESGPQISSPRSSIHVNELEAVPDRRDDGPASPTGPADDTRDLEMWGWSNKLTKWSPDQISLLKSSWRSSTLRTYKVAWNRWLLWARKNNVSQSHPHGSDLAQFLADLHLKFKLSYNTILLHKSVVCTLANTDNSEHLRDNTLVKHVLKSIILKNPKPSKPPVWDVNVFASFLTGYGINENVFHTVRHTAALLVLCSGRRIHDLTLLNVDNNHCIINDDYIILWPLFGSKTDCSTYRQSGWKLLRNNQNKNLDPTFWIKRTISLLNERRVQCGCSNLFITLRGSPAAASRTVIAGWIKSLMKEAGISATPGSVRSAVASRNWVDNFPLDDILARGNWKSVNTFKKFYRREVMSSNNNSSITAFFQSV
ncbi:uncharacterized protein LOC126374610 [Pectinophora gossypiella]|uniref:uncharacterized protein LOC126374610 n=1 Tax=Pectinophora gossypiella TaxID=13191 RepID=UPI00214EDC87|nr:uncharacterized protein LOC126374610 [Pectinophora gossypiella]